MSPPPSQETGLQLTSKDLHTDELALLLDVVGHPTSSVAARFRRLGLSVQRGTQLVDRLVGAGLLASTYIATPAGRVRYLQLTPAGAACFKEGDYTINANRYGGPEHEYWTHRLDEYLTERGYVVRRQVRLGNGHIVDLLATKPDVYLLVDIETGKSTAHENLLADMAVPGARVLQFAISKPRADALRRRLPADGEGRCIIWSPEDLHARTAALGHATSGGQP